MTSVNSDPQRDGDPILLSALEFDVLWEHLNLGIMPLVVKVPSPGKTYDERAELERTAWDGLEARGLGRPVAVHPEIEHLLRLMVNPERELDARTWVGRGVRLFAASTGSYGVLAALVDGQLAVKRTSATGLAAAAVSLLPAHPAGQGQSVTLRTEEFESAAKAAGGTQKGFEDALLTRGVRADDAYALCRMISDVRGTGNFGAAARDRLGRRQRAERVVSFFDTDEGRFVQIRRQAGDGTMWTTISPADSRRLTQQVEELLGEVVSAAER